MSIATQLPGGRAPPGSQKGGVPEGRGAPGLGPWATGEGKGASRACGHHPAAQALLHSRCPRRSLEAEQAGSPCYRSPGRLSSKEVCSVPWLQGNLGAVKQAGQHSDFLATWEVGRGRAGPPDLLGPDERCVLNLAGSPVLFMKHRPEIE